MRAFLDTNVLVSAFASRGLCAELFEIVLLEHDLAVGARMLVELRKSLRQKIKLPAGRCDEIVEFTREQATTLIQSAEPVSANVDEDDARILGEALQGQADVFVTGDGAVQRLSSIGGMKILSPRRFWEYLESRL